MRRVLTFGDPRGQKVNMTRLTLALLSASTSSNSSDGSCSCPNPGSLPHLKFGLSLCMYIFLFLCGCVFTDLNLSQFIGPVARGRRNDEMIRLGVWHIPYSFRDAQELSLASA